MRTTSSPPCDRASPPTRRPAGWSSWTRSAAAPPARPTTGGPARWPQEWDSSVLGTSSGGSTAPARFRGRQGATTANRQQQRRRPGSSGLRRHPRRRSDRRRCGRPRHRDHRPSPRHRPVLVRRWARRRRLPVRVRSERRGPGGPQRCHLRHGDGSAPVRRHHVGPGLLDLQPGRLPAHADGLLQRGHADRLRPRVGPDRTLLLPGRRVGVLRPRLPEPAPIPLRRPGRFRHGLHHGSRVRPPRAEPARVEPPGHRALPAATQPGQRAVDPPGAPGRLPGGGVGRQRAGPARTG